MGMTVLDVAAVVEVLVVTLFVGFVDWNRLRSPEAADLTDRVFLNEGLASVCVNERRNIVRVLQCEDVGVAIDYSPGGEKLLILTG